MPTRLTEHDGDQENVVVFGSLNDSSKPTTEILPTQDHSQVECAPVLADHDETGIVGETVDEGQQETEDIPPDLEEHTHEETEYEVGTGSSKTDLVLVEVTEMHGGIERSRDQVEDAANCENMILEETRHSIQSDVLPGDTQSGNTGPGEVSSFNPQSYLQYIQFYYGEMQNQAAIRQNQLNCIMNILETTELLARQLAEYEDALVRSPMAENQTSTDFHLPSVRKRQLDECENAVVRSPIAENQTSSDFHLPCLMERHLDQCGAADATVRQAEDQQLVRSNLIFITNIWSTLRNFLSRIWERNRYGWFQRITSNLSSTDSSFGNITADFLDAWRVFIGRMDMELDERCNNIVRDFSITEWARFLVGFQPLEPQRLLNQLAEEHRQSTLSALQVGQIRRPGLFRDTFLGIGILFRRYGFCRLQRIMPMLVLLAFYGVQWFWYLPESECSSSCDISQIHST